METYIVRQIREVMEALTSFETRNRYVVHAEDGAELYRAEEVGGSLLGRTFLKSMRPFTLDIRGAGGQRVLQVDRPFRWIFSHIDVLNDDGSLAGSVTKRFTILKRVFDVCDEQGRVTMQIEGPVLHPWTFHVYKGGREVATILKKFSGIGTEMFTDADTFAFQVESDLSPNEKSVLLGAVFLIDFAYFEDNVKNGVSIGGFST